METTAGDICSNMEKKVAKRIFDEAFKKENNIIIEKIKELAAKATSYSDIMDIRKYINGSIKRLNQTYNYSYSRLIYVFAELLFEHIISENDLDSFSNDKVDNIRPSAGSKVKGE